MTYTIYDQRDTDPPGMIKPMKDAARPYLVVERYYRGYRIGMASRIVGRYRDKKQAQQAIRRDSAK